MSSDDQPKLNKDKDEHQHKREKHQDYELFLLSFFHFFIGLDINIKLATRSEATEEYDEKRINFSVNLSSFED